MNSLEIQYFLTIVKYGSFTEAAQALSVSQPAISKQIRQLEAELGCSLFARSGRTLSLTEAGQAYHAYFQQCRFQLDLLKNRLEEQKQDGIAILRIAYPEDVEPSYIREPALAAASAMETPVRLEFSCYPEGELVNLLTDGKADLILTGIHPDAEVPRGSGNSATTALLSQSGSPAAFHPLSVRPFSEVPQVLLYASTHPEATDLSDFRNDTFLFSETDASLQSSQNLYPLFQRFGFAPKIRFAANLSTILDLTAQDEGVYLTHAWSRGCKRTEYRTLTLPFMKKFYVACADSTQKPEIKELFQRLVKPC